MIGGCSIPIVAVLLAAAVSTAAAVPNLPDLDGAEPQVRIAIRKARDDVRAEPESAATWGRYGSVLDAHVFMAEAVRAYEVAGELDKDDFRWPYLLAILVSPEDPVASLSHMEHALARNDAYAPLYLRYAAMMEAMGRGDEARAAYERAVALEDGNPYAHAGLGRCLLAAGDEDNAKVHLNRAMELDHRCRPALSAMAAYARRRGDMDAVRRWSHRASAAPAPAPRDEVLAGVRRLGVSTTEMIRRANEMQEAGQPDTGRQALEWLVRQNPASIRGRKRLAEFHMIANDAAAAAEQYRAALAVEPQYVPARLGLAHLLTRTGRAEEAQREYETVLAGHPSSVPAHRGLAICLATQGRMEQAAEHFGRVIELAPGDNRARLAWGSALLGAGQYDRAADVLEVLVTGGIDPGDDLALQARTALGGALCGLAERHASNGELEATSARLARAATLLGEAAHVRGEVAMQYARSASVLTHRDDWAAAIELLRRGLVLFPASAQITNELAWMLATTPDAELRDGAAAVTFAERAVELTGGESYNELDTLAAAYAEAGRYDEAIATAERALAIAKRAGRDDLVSQLTDRLHQLKSRRPSP